VPDDRDVEVKLMFGRSLGAFVNGNMFMGLFGPDVGEAPEPTKEDSAPEPMLARSGPRNVL